MPNIANSVTELIGKTPLLRLNRIEAACQTEAKLIAKLERFNPGGSAKDRVGLEMIERAEREGLIKPGATLIEPTSGNTGIGLAMAAAVRGYKAVLVMPESMSLERRRLIAAYGAEVVLTPAAEGMSGSVKKAEQLNKSIEGSFIPSQFANPANPEAHYKTTGPELWGDCGGELDIFVAAIGTGGTISGTGRYLKEQRPEIKVIGVEPAASPLLTEGRAGSHKIQGIGANFIPETLDRKICDEIMTVTDEQAMEAARLCAKTEGMLVGISSGAALAAAVELAKRPQNSGKTIALLLPDTGERYLSSELFAGE